MKHSPPPQIPVQNPAREPVLAPPRWRGLRMIAALVIREMGSTYGPSPGGYLWAVISPVGAVILLSTAMSFFIHSPALGTSFTLFYATGYLPFDIYSQIQSKVSASMKFSRALLAYPSLIWVHAIAARFLLNFLTAVAVFCIVFVGILAVIDTRTVIDIRPIVEGLFLAGLLGLGVGMMNCLLMGLFPVWERVWAVISRPLFLASGILFLYDGMPRFAQEILWWNPLVHVIGLVRRGFYPTYHANYVSIPYVSLLSLILIALAILFLRRYHQRVLEI